jgi:hypothetical protein
MQYAKLEGEYDFGLCENWALKSKRFTIFTRPVVKGSV